MEATTSKMETPPEPPVRILVQTLTHLVPGKESSERKFYILDRICQHHWNCDFSAPKFRWASYDTKFALNNRRCFFLVDYGESQNDDEVPILSYEWTGETLKPLPQLASDSEIRAKLRDEVPFTWKPSNREKPKVPIPKIIKSRLYHEENLHFSEMDYMREHPEDMQWLKVNLKPRLWRKFVAHMNSHRSADDPLIEE